MTRADAVVRADAVTRTVYATDNSIYQVEPDAVALPRTADDIQRLVAAEGRDGRPRPIVARGGGTGTNGQSLTDGLVIEVKRHMNRLLSVDVEARTAVVEPGLVTAALNAELAEVGLFWAPHTSTLNRATVGGMISTDAAGKGSLVYGRAHRHVESLDVILDDGTPWTATPTPRHEAEVLAGQPTRIGRLWRSLLDLPLADEAEGADYGLPELARGFSGYGIDRVRRGELIDPVPLLCGAEGTLAIITRATIKLTPLPAATLLVIAGYDSFADALDDAVDLAATKPAAIECFDETTLEQGRSSPAWPVLDRVVGDHRGSVLLLEYTGDVLPDAAPIEAALAATGRSRAVNLTTDSAERAAAWKVRADAVGLLAKVTVGEPTHSARPTAFVEDCAVPVAEMAAFIQGFRAVLDGHGLRYGMFGHADVGCVHVRPALDLNDPEHAALIRTVTDDVVALVARHGGVLWGEHGRGFRGDSVETFLPSTTIEIMRAVKTAFDPDDRLNPGKLYRPLGADLPIVALDKVPLRGETNRVVPVAVRQEFDHAFACNGNGLCHHYDRAEVMCPSYKASGDPALSPKGRADLVRSWLARTKAAGGAAARGSDAAVEDLAEFETALADNLDRCLSCSACTGHCPVEVDIPELKSRFLERYYAKRRRPLSHHALSRFESLAPLLAKAPAVARLGPRLAGPALGLVDLPSPASRPPGRLQAFAPSNPTELVIVPDVFTASLEPATLHQAVAVLRAMGSSVSVAAFVPTGKFDHIKGKRRAFARAAKAQAALIDKIVASGAIPVVIEPAIALLHEHEYPTISSTHPTGVVRHLSEVLDERRDQLSARPSRSVTLLGHCTERAMSPGSLAAWIRVLEAAGHSVVSPAVGCCGMAGVFGHERSNQTMSRRLWDLTWAPAITAASDRSGDDPVVVATGFSCRSQAKRISGDPLLHPIHLL